jgi:hypothetical protein
MSCISWRLLSWMLKSSVQIPAQETSGFRWCRQIASSPNDKWMPGASRGMRQSGVTSQGQSDNRSDTESIIAHHQCAYRPDISVAHQLCYMVCVGISAVINTRRLIYQPHVEILPGLRLTRRAAVCCMVCLQVASVVLYCPPGDSTCVH